MTSAVTLPVLHPRPANLVDLILAPSRLRSMTGMAAAVLALTACASTPPPASPPVQIAGPTRPAEPTAIVLDAADQTALVQTVMQLVGRPTQELVGWTGARSGIRGAVKVLRDGYDGQSRRCREFHSLVVLGPLSQHATGFLCQNGDGSWSISDLREYPLQRDVTPKRPT